MNQKRLTLLSLNANPGGSIGLRIVGILIG